MSDPAFNYVSFLSDYGLTDEFVGVCHGVMLNIAPHLKIIDITHGIKPHSIREGAMVLAQAVKYMPEGVHMAIVDPGVGTKRLAVVIQTKSGSMLVGPDNGLLPMAATRLGGSVKAHQITNQELMLQEPSRTFHGRDIFAPAAAHLASGVDIGEFGPEVAIDSLVGLTFAEPRMHDDHYHACVLHVDRFGNLQLNVGPPEMAAMNLAVGAMIEVRVEGHRGLVTYGEAFGSVPHGELVVASDSYGLMAVSVNHGNAAERLGATLGSSVIIGPPGSGASD